MRRGASAMAAGALRAVRGGHRPGLRPAPITVDVSASVGKNLPYGGFATTRMSAERERSPTAPSRRAPTPDAGHLPDERRAERRSWQRRCGTRSALPASTRRCGRARWYDGGGMGRGRSTRAASHAAHRLRLLWAPTSSCDARHERRVRLLGRDRELIGGHRVAPG